VIETSDVALPPDALQVVQVWSKSVSNEGHFTREAETVFRPYLASRWSGVSEKTQIALPALALQAQDV
jgi:hypothetical protein